MDKYDDYEDNQNKKVLEPWQYPPDPELEKDLDFEEFAYLNTLDELTEDRVGGLPFWVYVAISLLLLFFFQAFIFHDALNDLLYAQKIASISIPEQYQDQEQLLAARQAVVLIRGDTSRGSGFNIRTDGLVVTNRHVVENESAVKIYFPDGSSYVTSEWMTSSGVDLAILNIKGENLPVVTLDQSGFEAGEKVYFIGSPESSWWMMTEGRAAEYYEGGMVIGFKMDENIGSGASGSPILNSKGEAGAVLFAVNKNDASEAYAVPAGLILQYILYSGLD